MHEDKNLQIENGNFTRIANAILDALISAPITSSELRVVIAILRKTYGWQKKEDDISLSQLVKMTTLSKRSVIYILQNLEAKKIISIVRIGKRTNHIAFNKYNDTWLVQNIAPQVKMNRNKATEWKNRHVQTFALVQNHVNASAKLRKKLVQGFAHTKETKETNTKETSKLESLQGTQWNELIDSFKEVNPMYTDFYKNTTERKALEDMASKWGYDKLLATINELPKIIGQPYAPKITKPTELRRDIGKLIAFYQQEKNKFKIKKPTVI